MSLDTWDLARDRFPTLRRMTYLDSASFGIASERVAKAQAECAQLLCEIAPASPDGLAFWEEGNIPHDIPENYDGLNDWRGVHELRQRCAEVIGCEPESISWCENTTSAFLTLLSFFKWQPGDELVTTDLEHDSILNVCELFSNSRGITVCQVPVRDLVGEIDFGSRLEDRIAHHVTQRSRLVLFSHIFYSCGFVVDVRRICDAIRMRNPETFVVVDGAHAMGQLPLSVKDYGCDAYVTSGSKWLLAPPGTGILYLAQWNLNLLWPTDIYQSIVPVWWKEAARTLRYSSADSSHHVLGVTPQGALVGLRSAIEDYLMMGAENIWQRIRHNSLEARDILGSLGGINVTTASDATTGMVFLERGDRKSEDVSRIVGSLRRRGIIVAGVRTPPSIRVSVHYFNNGADIQLLAQQLNKLAR